MVESLKCFHIDFKDKRRAQRGMWGKDEEEIKIYIEKKYKIPFTEFKVTEVLT